MGLALCWQVQLKSGGLTFHFNRPTIVSLIACVTELTTLPRRASTALGAPPTTPGRQQSGVPALEEAQAEEGHVTFALLLDMEETQLFLNVENSPVPLALCLQERLHVSVKVSAPKHSGRELCFCPTACRAASTRPSPSPCSVPMT